MKKLLAVFMASLMVFSLAACAAPAAQSAQPAQEAPAQQAADDAAPQEDEALDSPNKCFEIGVMQFGEFTALTNAYDGFVEGLKENGWVEGENFKITYKSANADTANCPAIADLFINNNSDLIFAIATPSVSCAKEKTSTIPILFTAVTDAVASGLVESNEKPGANITGTSDMNPVKEQIDLLKELLPNAKNVAVMYCTSESNSAVQVELAKAEIEALGMTFIDKGVASIDFVQEALESLNGNADAIYIPTDNTLADGMEGISQKANELGLPIIAGEPGQVQSGATATFGIDYVQLGKQSAKMAIEILTSQDPIGATANMPVGFQTEGCETAINQASIDALKLDVPQSILDRANKY